MTLVELLVAMAVTSILLVGLTSAFFNVSGVYGKWADRLQGAQVGIGVAASLQLDTHRYVFCGQTQNGGSPQPYLFLCWPDQLGTPVVSYHVTGSKPWVITRQVGQTATFIARSVTPPGFWIDCFDHEGKTVSGHVHLYNFRQGDGLGGSSAENFSVYYVAPWRTGCPPQ